MTKGTINRPGPTPRPSTLRPQDRARERAQVQRPQRPQRAQGVHAPGAQQVEGDDDAAAAAAGNNQAVEVDAGGDSHRGRHVDDDAAWEQVRRARDDHGEGETGAVGVDGIKRQQSGQQQGGGGGSQDGFSGQKGQREAYDRLLRGNVESDANRIEDLVTKGLRDDFHPELQAKEVEGRGPARIAAHVVRLYDHHTLSGLSRTDSVAAAAAWLSQLSTPQAIRKVLQELESKPIRDVYPLEVMLHLLDHRPELMPGVKPGNFIANASDLKDGKRVFAGHPNQVHLGPDVRLKAMALLGGNRPGYEFHPTANDPHKYTLLVDTPGRWTFAVLATTTTPLGKMQRESADAALQLIDVTVHAMGVKGEPVTPEQWQQAQLELDDDRDDHDDGDDRDGDEKQHASPQPKDTVRPPPPAAAHRAPLLILQIRTALDLIVRDDATNGATTYSWECILHRPGEAIGTSPVALRLVVERAGPFDPVWAQAREALVKKQRELEPGRALLTPEDIQAALRRARVR